jgi:hypothetical protein
MVRCFHNPEVLISVRKGFFIDLEAEGDTVTAYPVLHSMTFQKTRLLDCATVKTSKLPKIFHLKSEKP